MLLLCYVYSLALTTTYVTDFRHLEYIFLNYFCYYFVLSFL